MTGKRTIFELDVEAEKADDTPIMAKGRVGRKPGRIKTLTTRKRKVEITFPTEEYKAEVYKKAKEMGIPVSKFILACISEKNDVAGPSSKELRKAQNRIVMLESEIATLKQDKVQLSVLVERLTDDLALWRTREGPVPVTGIEDHRHKLDNQLIALFKDKREVSGIDVVETLKIDITNKKASEALWKDLEALKSAGLIETTVEGWRWLGK